MSRSIIKKLASETAIYGLSSIIGRLLGYLLVPLYTGIFALSEYGIVTELYGYVGFLIVVFTYGMETAFFRYVKDAKEPLNVYTTVLSSIIVSSVLLSGTIMLFSGFFANLLSYSNDPGMVYANEASYAVYIICFALVLGFDAIAAVPFAKLRYDERPMKFAFIKLLNIALNIGLVLFFLVFCPHFVDKSDVIHNLYDPSVRVGYIFMANLIASTVTLLLLLPEMRVPKWVFDKVLWQKMMRYALPLVVVGFAGAINEMFDRAFLKFMLPYDPTTNMEKVGIYGACYKLSILMTLFTQAFRMAGEPFFFAQSNKGNAKEVYAFTMKYFFIIGTLIFIGVMLYIDIVKYFINSRYHEGLPVVPILLLANLFLGVYYNLSIWYKLTNKTKIGAMIAVAGAVLTLCLNVLLVPVFGYMGSAWVTLICYAFMVFLSYKLCQKHYPIPYNLNEMGFYLVVAVAIVLLDMNLVSKLQNIVVLYTLRTLIIAAYMALIYKKEYKKVFTLKN